MRRERTSDEVMTRDDPIRSGGYDDAADEFIAQRSPIIGVALIREWVRTLPARGAVLDLGCGHGVPVTQTLVDGGMSVYAVDASPRLVAAFRARFPDVPVECAPVEQSSWFDRSYDGIVAWGLLFLLAQDVQLALIRKAGGMLRVGGSLAFTAPAERGEWTDVLSGHRSISLGAAEYRRALEDAGLRTVREADDEGENHYYFAVR